MSRLGNVFWFVLVIASGMTNFLVKQTVQNLDDRLTRVRRETLDEQKKIHDLTAEWTFLNQPELLADLNSRYIHLVPMSPKQVVTNLAAIPLRPPPPAPPPPAAPQDTPAQIAEAAPPGPAPPVPTAASPPRAPIVPASATVPLHAPIVPAAVTAPARAASRPAPHPASLDALFAQVAGNR